MNAPLSSRNSLRRAALTLLAVLGAGAVFAAEEKPAARLPAWAQGWIVGSVTIPVDGEIQHATVDFQSPAGEAITLAPGAVSKAGIMLKSIAWEGTPVRARVRIGQNEEAADLLVPAALVAKSTVQKKLPRHIDIESRFIEVSEAAVRKLKTPAGLALFPRPADAGGRGRGTVAGLLTEAQAGPLLAQLTKMKGVDVLSAPRVTTRPGQRAVIEIIREFRYPTEWEKDPEKKDAWLPTAFETRNTGVTLEVEPTIAADKGIDLRLSPQVVEYLGWVDVETGKPVPAATDGVGNEGRRRRPVFSARKAAVDVSIFPGNTVIFGGFGETEDIHPFKRKKPGHRLLVFVTARTVE